jgi:hypothetical protein
MTRRFGDGCLSEKTKQGLFSRTGLVFVSDGMLGKSMSVFQRGGRSIAAVLRIFQSAEWMHSFSPEAGISKTRLSVSDRADSQPGLFSLVSVNRFRT